jgi:hypothetical protein
MAWKKVKGGVKTGRRNHALRTGGFLFKKNPLVYFKVI